MGRTGSSSESRKPFKKPEENVPNVDDSAPQTISVVRPQRSLYVWLSLLLFTIYGFRAVYQQQFEKLPIPLSAEKAGKRGFSEAEALKHVKALTSLGPHPVGSDALDLALEYVLKTAEKIKKTAHWEVDVEVQKFHAKSGVNRLSGGLFRGKTLILQVSVEEKRMHVSEVERDLLKKKTKYVVEAEKTNEDEDLEDQNLDTLVLKKKKKNIPSNLKDRPQFKRNKAKGPNPLSCLKKKVKPSPHPVSEKKKDDDSVAQKRTRKRKRSRKAKAPTETVMS